MRGKISSASFIWLDRVSAQTLAFVARRLLAERVVVLFAVRGPRFGPIDDELVGLPELVVRGLIDDDARALLASVVPGRLDERIIDRIIAETRGNPLALLELPRGLSATELAGGFGRPDARPLANQIEQSYLRRIAALPVPTQKLLLAAAAEPVGDVALLRRVAGRLALEADAAAAEAAGLIEFGTRVSFRHPLVRSAAYRAADPEDRQRTCIGHWLRRPTPDPTRTAGPGIAPTRRPNPTRRWPRSSNARPIAPVPAAESRRRPPS
jgi:hypothetical protein